MSRKGSESTVRPSRTRITPARSTTNSRRDASGARLISSGELKPEATRRRATSGIAGGGFGVVQPAAAAMRGEAPARAIVNSRREVRMGEV
jgi:hypothetical protein